LAALSGVDGGGGGVAGSIFAFGGSPLGLGAGAGFVAGVVVDGVSSLLQPEITTSEKSMAESVDQALIPSLILTGALLVKFVAMVSLIAIVSIRSRDTGTAIGH
jgi:hypothetical protein